MNRKEGIPNRVRYFIYRNWYVSWVCSPLPWAQFLNVQIARVGTNHTTLFHVIVIVVRNCVVGHKAMSRHSYQSRSPQVYKREERFWVIE